MDSGLAPAARPGITHNMSAPDASKIPVAELTQAQAKAELKRPPAERLIKAAG